LTNEVKIDPDITLYESKPIAEINAELNQAGIVPNKTIKAVISLVKRHLNHHHRRGHHGPKVLKTIAGLKLQTFDGLRRPWEIGRAAPVRILN
jgi:hypothetical protein